MRVLVKYCATCLFYLTISRHALFQQFVTSFPKNHTHVYTCFCLSRRVLFYVVCAHNVYRKRFFFSLPTTVHEYWWWSLSSLPQNFNDTATKMNIINLNYGIWRSRGCGDLPSGETNATGHFKTPLWILFHNLAESLWKRKLEREDRFEAIVLAIARFMPPN